MTQKALIKGHRFVVLGRAGIDLYPDPAGSKIEQAELMRPALGGSSGNIAAGIVRLGGSAHLLSVLSDDPIGRLTRRQLQQYRIALTHVHTLAGNARTTLAFVENLFEGHEAIIYRNRAVDLELRKEHVDAVDFASFDALVLTGTALSANPSREASLYAMQLAKRAGKPVVLDLDFRPTAWERKEDAQEIYMQASSQADLLVGNDVEFDVLSPDSGLETAHSLGEERIVIYKMGEKGAKVIEHGHRWFAGIFKVKALKPVGAGDGFMAGLLMALARGCNVQQAVIEGAANAAIVVTREACAPAMATRAELDDFLQLHQENIDAHPPV